MDLQKLYDMAAEYDEFSCKPKERKYKIGEVIDEDKSVRWNREEVERRNKLHEEEVKRLNTEKIYCMLNGLKLYMLISCKKLV